MKRSDHAITTPGRAVEGSASTRPGYPLRPLLLFSVFAVLIFPAHELAHYSAYQLLGIPVAMTLNTASPRNPRLRRPVAELAGPVLNLFVAGVAAAVYARRRRPTWLAELGLAAAMMRLVVYALVVAAMLNGSWFALSNDEPAAARLWRLPTLTFVVAFAIPFVGIAIALARGLWDNPWARWHHVLSRALVMLAVGVIVGSVLDPWFFPRR